MTTPHKLPSQTARCLPVVLAIAATSCATPASQGRTTTPATKTDPSEAIAKIARWRAWEPKELPKHRIQFADIGMTAELESATEPKITCQKLQSGSMLCAAEVDLGNDDDGEHKAFGCSALVDRTPLPLGVLFKRTLGERTVEEAPAVEIATNKQGTMARIIVPSFARQEDGSVFGTTKVAVTYGPGFSLACEDNNAGANAAFKRITEGFFASATFAKPASTPAFRYAFKRRRGDTLLGFSLSDVFKEEDGYYETHAFFDLEIEGNVWHIVDGQRFVDRDEKGAVDSLRSVRWFEGTSSVSLSAKPGESGKMRVKLESGDKRDALELTPEAPLSTEVWEASKLLAVSTGKAKSHRYGFLSITSDGEPTIAYANLTRAQQGVILEEIENKSGGKKRKSDAEAPERNEISVDERGFATKQVSPDTILERILVEGELPAPAAATGPRRRAH